MGPRLVFSVAMLAALVSAKGAIAAPRELIYEAPPECPSRAEVAESIESQLRSARDRETAASVVARVRRVQAQGYELELSVRTGEHTAMRSLTAEDCRELAEAAALLAALAIKGDLPAEASAAEQRPPPPRAKSEERLPYQAGLFARAALVGLPRASLGPGVRLAFGRSFWDFELELGQYFSPALDVAGVPGASLSLATTWVGLRACGRGDFGIRIGPCLGAEGQRMAASTKGVRREGEATHYWVRAGAWLSAVARLSDRWRATGDLGVLFPLSPRPLFSVDSVGEIGGAGPVGISADLGVALAFD